MSIRIILVGPGLDVGGTEKHILQIAPRLRGMGIDLSYFPMYGGGALEGKLRDHGIVVHTPSNSPWRLIRAATNTIRLRRVIRSLRPDIVHCFLAEPYLVGTIASLGIHPLKIMSRRSLSLYQVKHPFLARIEHKLIDFADAVIANSNAVARDLLFECGAPDKIGIIYNGFELPAGMHPSRSEVRTRLGISPKTFVIVVIANLFPYKGHDDLLAALGRVRSAFGADWRLLIIGADRGFGSQLASQAERLGVNQNIVWLGEQESVDGFLHAADVGVLPSHEEGFSNSLIEKMGHGLPVVATAVGGNIDAIVNEESGLLVPARDPSALGNALLRLYNDALLRRRLGSAARLRVVRTFSAERCLERYMRLYKYLFFRRKGALSGFIDETNKSLLVDLSTLDGTTLRSPERIMIVTTDLLTGGAETMLVRLVTADHALAQRVTVVNLLKGNHYSEELTRAGVRIVECEIDRYSGFFSALLRIARTIREERPDIVQGWMYHGNIVALLALVMSGFRRRTSLAWSIRCSGMDLDCYSWTLRLFVKAGILLSRYTDLLTANSFEGMAAHLQMGYCAPRRCVICNGIDTELFKPNRQRRQEIRRALSIDEDAVIVAHVARVDPMKDHATFLAAMRRLPSVYAFAIGEGTENLPDLPNLKRWGRRVDVADLFASADIVVSSSAFGEGFSNAIAEGMACSLPAVATDVGDASEIVGDTGLIVPPRDVDSMTAAIRELSSESRAAREARGLLARSRIVNRFALPRAVEQFSATYRWVLNSKQTPLNDQQFD